MRQPIKRFVKRGLQHVAARFGPHRRNHTSPQLLVLMYHRVLPPHDPRAALEEPGMMVTPETFKENLKIVSQLFDIISFSEYIGLKLTNKPLPPKAAIITFDDGWQDNYQYASPILLELQLPATIFLVSEMIGTDKMFWPERLAKTVINIASTCPDYWREEAATWLRCDSTTYQFSNVPPSTEQISQLITNVKQFDDQEIHERLDIIDAELQCENKKAIPSLMSWEQVAELDNTGLLGFGSHTCNHIRLNSQTPQDIVESEIIHSKKMIEEHLNKPVNTFCFPNGDYTQHALNIVKQNYKCAVTTNSGWNNSTTDNYLLNRIGIHEDIAHDKIAFLSRISGWL